MVGLQDENQEKSQTLIRVGQAKFRHRAVSGNLSANSSARLRLSEQVSTGNVAEVRSLDFVNQ